MRSQNDEGGLAAGWRWVSAAVALLAALLAGGLALAGDSEKTKAKVATADLAMPPNQAAGYSECPGSKRVVGGGLLALDDQLITTNTSGPLDETGATANTVDGDVATQWYASAQGSGGDFRIYALCSASSDAKIEASIFMALTPAKASASRGPTVLNGEGVAKCAGGKRAIGGGVVQDGMPNGLQIFSSGPLDATGKAARTNDGDVPKQWYAAVQGVDPVPPFKVFAICSASSDATLEVKNFDADPGDSEAVVKCGKGERVTGGGVVHSANVFTWTSGPLDSSGDAASTENGDKATQWSAGLRNIDGGTHDVKVIAICE